MGELTIDVVAEHRPFPPSPRRRAGTPGGPRRREPHLVAGGAWLGALVGLVLVARGAGAQIGGWIASACRASDGGPASLTLDALLRRRSAQIALPLLAATALAAFAAHVAQTRTLWIPRRTIPGAPTVPTGRGRHAALDLGAAIAIGGVAFA